MIEGLPADVCLKILCLLDHQNLATAQLGQSIQCPPGNFPCFYIPKEEFYRSNFQVCRKWRSLASENVLWFNLFIIRWGEDSAAFYAPEDSKSWKDVYVVQDRCDRVGLGLRIIREGEDYYLVHQGEIQQHLGRRRHETGEIHRSAGTFAGGECLTTDEPCAGILDKILFFIGDLENACVHAKRRHRIL